LFVIVIASVSVPLDVTIIPAFMLLTSIGWINTYWALIVPQLANAYGIFFMKQYFETIPSDFVEAARVDGAHDLRIFRQIMLPMAKPALGGTGIFLFFNAWTQYMWPLIMTKTPEMYTIPIGLSSLFFPYNADYALLMAGSFLSTLPILTTFLLLQKQFISGLVMGGVKG